MKEELLELSQKFWKGILEKDVETMTNMCHKDCFFVHIGGNADVEKEMYGFTSGLFQPTNIDIHKQEVHEYGNVGIVISDVDYGLLLDGKETTHHFTTTEVFQDKKLIQFTFTALTY